MRVSTMPSESFLNKYPISIWMLKYSELNRSNKLPSYFFCYGFEFLTAYWSNSKGSRLFWSMADWNLCSSSLSKSFELFLLIWFDSFTLSSESAFLSITSLYESGDTLFFYCKVLRNVIGIGYLLNSVLWSVLCILLYICQLLNLWISVT